MMEQSNPLPGTAERTPLPRFIWVLAFLTFLAAWRLADGQEAYQLGAAVGTAAFPLGLTFVVFRRWPNSAMAGVTMIVACLLSLSVVAKQPLAARKAHDAVAQQVERASAQTKTALDEFVALGGTELTGVTTATQVEERLRLVREIRDGTAKLWQLVATDEPLRRALEYERVRADLANMLLQEQLQDPERRRAAVVVQVQLDWCAAAEAVFAILLQHPGEWQVDDSAVLTYAASADEQFRGDAEAAITRLAEREEAWHRATLEYVEHR